MDERNKRRQQLDIGIFTICYNGYGQYIARWCKSIAESTVQPTSATVALFGDNHGLSDEMADECKRIIPRLNVVHCGEHASIGTDRNKAVEETRATWIMLLDADDALLPNGLEEIRKHASDDVDVVAVAYMEEKLNGGTKIHLPPEVITDENLFKWRANWISPYSPFRRLLWEETQYVDGEFPNAPMVFSFLRNNARWASTNIPCARHIRRENTHSFRESGEERMRVNNILDGYARSGLEIIRRRNIDT